MARVFFDGVLLDPELPAPVRGGVLVEGGRIVARLPEGAAAPADAERVALGERLLAPGYLDLHYHGRLIFGHAAQAERELADAGRRLLRHGVTAFLPTTVAWPRQRLLAQVSAWAAACDALANDARGAIAQPLGLHLEGPWIRAEAAGAQPLAAVRPYDAGEGAEVLARAEGWLRMVTLAPEAPGASKLLDALARAGIRAALGHSHADERAVLRAIDAGASHVTHLFNAMGALHHRQPGLAGVTLTDERLSCDLICDGIHVHPAMVRLATRAVKAPRLSLISDRVEPPDDAARAASEDAPARDDAVSDASHDAAAPVDTAGTADTASTSAADTDFGAGLVVEQGGALRLPDGRLAGSALTLDRAVQNAHAFGGLTLLEAVAAATLHPARVLGIEAQHGALQSGSRADLLLLDPTGAIQQIWLAGQRVEPSSGEERR